MGLCNTFQQFQIEALLNALDFVLEIKFFKCKSDDDVGRDIFFSRRSFRNGVDVEGASHKQVVDLIKHSADELHLLGRSMSIDEYFITVSFDLVIASTPEESHSDVHSGEESSGSSNDYSERRSLAITIPDYSLVEVNDEKFYVCPSFVSFSSSTNLFFQGF